MISIENLNELEDAIRNNDATTILKFMKMGVKPTDKIYAGRGRNVVNPPIWILYENEKSDIGEFEKYSITQETFEFLFEHNILSFDDPEIIYNLLSNNIKMPETKYRIIRNLIPRFNKNNLVRFGTIPIMNILNVAICNSYDKTIEDEYEKFIMYLITEIGFEPTIFTYSILIQLHQTKLVDKLLEQYPCDLKKLNNMDDHPLFFILHVFHQVIESYGEEESKELMNDDIETINWIFKNNCFDITQKYTYLDIDSKQDNCRTLNEFIKFIGLDKTYVNDVLSKWIN